MEPERIDLSALDPAEDQLAYERLVRRVMHAAGPEIERRARASGALALVADWARPAVAAASIIAALAAGGLMTTDRPPAGDAEGSVVSALGMPNPAADWLEADRQPDSDDLVLAMERRP